MWYRYYIFLAHRPICLFFKFRNLIEFRTRKKALLIDWRFDRVISRLPNTIDNRLFFCLNGLIYFAFRIFRIKIVTGQNFLPFEFRTDHLIDRLSIAIYNRCVSFFWLCFSSNSRFCWSLGRDEAIFLPDHSIDQLSINNRWNTLSWANRPTDFFYSPCRKSLGCWRRPTGLFAIWSLDRSIW